MACLPVGTPESDAGTAPALAAQRLPVGSLADHPGLHKAFTVELALIGISAVLLAAGLQAAKRHRRGKSPP